MPSTPLRDAPSARPAFDASPTREPAEARFEEAGRRPRRRGMIVGIVVAATIAVTAILVSSSLDGTDPPDGQGAVPGAPMGASPFGVFDPLRGRIVYVAGDELMGIDPADPSSIVSIALPAAMDPRPVVSGWSADGTRLALTSEDSDTIYLMNAKGRFARARSPMGCCMFVTDPWLSPDGTTVLESVTSDRLFLHSFATGDRSRVIELDPPVEGVIEQILPVHAWSPDGTRIAFIVDRLVRTALEPSIHVVDLETGTTRELVTEGLGEIPHMTWSPDGSELLVIARAWQDSPQRTWIDPFTPAEAGLYLVDADRFAPAVSASASNPIASGHYRVATWSPDGGWIAALDSTPMGRDLVLMRADGSASRPLVAYDRYSAFTGLAWHPSPGPPIPDPSSPSLRRGSGY